MTDLTNHVLAGIALLDDRRPGWRHLVSRERLDLSSSTACILGQVFQDETAANEWSCSGYEKGLHHLSNETGLTHHSLRYEYGFSTNHEDYSYRELTKEWLRLLDEPATQPEESVLVKMKGLTDPVDIFIALTGSTAPRYLIAAALA